ncbi:proton-coupled amino acid transporter-like protein CG1139 [Bacillus rossius redtenbacheri]|uniref:proton-coupled amino acid transporter-like protein CG1139 n=1 Tax=Bacillus rossius redtenbacheri TaxID=93214 RepID=UPI002FDE8439
MPPPASEDMAMAPVTVQTNARKSVAATQGDVVGKQSEYKEYQPFEERRVDNPTTNAETLFNFIKCCMGTGILAMPNAFYNSGYVLGGVGMLVIASVVIYCKHMLLWASYEQCQRKKVPSLNLPDTVLAACCSGPPLLRRSAAVARGITEWFVFAYMSGVLVVYTVFVGDNLKAVVDQYAVSLDVRLYMLFSLPLFVAINLVRDLKFLAPFSVAANLLAFLSIGIVLYYVGCQLWQPGDIEPVGQLANIPLFLGTAMFAVECASYVLTFEHKMKRPQDYGGLFGVLNQGLVFIVLMYLVMGLMGYVAYGSGVKGSITLNLPNEPLAHAVRVMLCATMFVTHALHNYVAVDILWTARLSRRFPMYPRLGEYCVRITIVVVAFLLAVAIPQLELFISLLGALCQSVLGIIVPALVDTASNWYSLDGGRLPSVVAKNLALAAIGLAGLLAGSYSALAKIVQSFQ